MPSEGLEQSGIGHELSEYALEKSILIWGNTQGVSDDPVTPKLHEDGSIRDKVIGNEQPEL